MNRKTKMLNIEIARISKNELLERLDSGVLVTPNVDHMVTLQKDREFYDIYHKAEWVVCDSRILYLCSKLTKDRITEAIPGSSFFTAYYQYHKDDPDCRIFLLGAAEGIAETAMRRINASVGRQIIVGAHSPSFGFEKRQDECEDIYRIINSSGANVVLVGVGAPKQEKWIFRHKDSMPGVKLWMALGATIDFEAGNIKRAPAIYRKLAIEWLYRIFQEPRRMMRRYFGRDLVFFIHFLRQLTGTYKDPFRQQQQ